MFRSPKSLLLASALLLAGLSVMGAEETGNAAPLAPPPRSFVNCPGITSVPMTADAEQALPLRIVGNLSCGAPVSVLSDSEGYTVHVSTADGADGYVARMYLTTVSPANAPRELQPSSASPSNGVVRWRTGEPGCDQFVAKGHTVESVTANGITVQIALEDTGWKLRATVAVANKSDQQLEILPGNITLDELRPTLKPLLAADPAKLSHVVNHQVLLSQASAQPSRSAVAFTQPNASGLAPAVYRPSTPDYFSEQVVPVSASNSAAIVPSSSELRSLSFRLGSLAPGQNTAATIWFERDANARELTLRVPVGDLVFDFPLSFNQKK